MTETVWRGAALVRPGTLAFTGSIGVTGRHSHHAVQIMAADTALTVLGGAAVASSTADHREPES